MGLKDKVSKFVDQGEKNIAAVGKAGRREARADFAVQLSGLAAGQENYLRQLGVAGTNLTAGISRSQARLESLTARARRGQQQVTRAQAGVVNRFGGELAGVAAQQFAPARATAAAGAARVVGEQVRGLGVSRAAEGVLAIAQEGAVAQNAAAEYQLNQALASRFAVSAETMAQLSGQLYMTALQYQMDWNMWKKQQTFAAKQAEKLGGNDAKTAVDRLTTTGPMIAGDAGDLVRAFFEEGGEGNEARTWEDMAVGQMVADWAIQNGYDPAGGEAAVMAETLRRMKAGRGDVNAGVALSGAVEMLYSDSKGFDKWGPAMLDSIRAGSLAETQARYGLSREEAGAATTEGTEAYPGQAGRIATGAAIGGVAGAVLGPPGIAAGAFVGGLLGDIVGGNADENRRLGEYLKQNFKTKAGIIAHLRSKGLNDGEIQFILQVTQLG